MALTSFNRRYFTHWRHYRRRLAKIQTWIDTPRVSGNSYLLPARLRLKLVAVEGDCTFTTSLSGEETDYAITQGEELILIVRANTTITVDAKGEVYVDLGFETSEWAKIVAISTSAGYGLSSYGIDPYGE